MRHFAVAIACTLISVSALAADAGKVLGLWLTPDDNAVIEVYREGERFSGRIVSLREPNYPANAEAGLAGKPKVDRNNPDESLRARPIVGLNLVQGFEYVGDGRYETGRIYDPRDGTTYQCEMALQEDGTLEVHGYVGIALFGKTQVWRPNS